MGQVIKRVLPEKIGDMGFIRVVVGFLLTINGKVIVGHRAEKLQGRPLFNKYKVAIEKFSFSRIKRIAKCEYFSTIFKSLAVCEDYKTFMNMDDTLKADKEVFKMSLDEMIRLNGE